MFLVSANLKLQGLTVVVTYEHPSDAPVFQVERELTFERCTFRAIGPAEGSRLVIAEGRKGTVVGCLFEGFETAIDIQAPPGMAVVLKQSIFLAAKPTEEATGQALRVRSMFGQGAAGCRLSFENCSTRAGSFLEVGNFKPASPLEVEVTDSAFLVKMLVDVEGDEPAPMVKEEKDSAIRWKGGKNRYQVTGGPWSNFPKAPTDLDAWARLTGETGSKVEALKLAKEPADPTTPKDCALLADDGKPAGADPGMVGPQ
jgi:eukaryotic-like serine/threonine-protein kinase